MSDDINRAAEKLAESLETIFQARKASVDSFRNLLSLANVAISAESAHREKAYGADDPRTLSMKSRLEMNQDAMRTLEVQSGLADIRTATRGEGEVLVEGWVGDAKGRGMEGLDVRLVDAKGEPIPDAAAATVQPGGYFALRMPAEAAAKIDKANPQGVSIAVLDAQRSVVGTTGTAVTLGGKGDVPLQQVVLKTSAQGRSTPPPRGAGAGPATSKPSSADPEKNYPGRAGPAATEPAAPSTKATEPKPGAKPADAPKTTRTKKPE